MTDDSPSTALPQPPTVPVGSATGSDAAPPVLATTTTGRPITGTPGAGTPAPPAAGTEALTPAMPVAAPHHTLPYESAPPRTQAVTPPSAPRYADRLAETASDAASTATAALGTAAEAAGDFVRRQQPLVMAVVFGLGVFLGILIRRR